MVSNMSLTSNRSRASSPASSRAWAVQFVDRVGDLADFLGGVHRQRIRNRLGATGFDLGDLLLEVGVGDLERTVAQHPQRHHQGARHQQDDDQRDHDGGQHQDGVDDRGVAPIGGLGVHRLRHRRGGVRDDLFGDRVGGLNRAQQVGIVDEHAGRIGHDRHPGHHLLLQRLGVGRADAEHFAHPEQRRRLGAGQGDHRGAQLRLGQVGATGHQDLLHRHLPAGPDRAAQTLRLGADLLIVDAHRRVDDVLGRQQQRRIGGHPVPQTNAVVGHLVQ